MSTRRRRRCYTDPGHIFSSDRDWTGDVCKQRWPTRSAFPEFMSTRAFRSGSLWNALPGPSRIPSRSIHHTLPRPNALSASATSTWNIHDFRFQDLRDNLQRLNPVPNRIWAHYTALLTDVGASTVPPELHHDVLRKCTPSFRANRRPVAI